LRIYGAKRVPAHHAAARAFSPAGHYFLRRHPMKKLLIGVCALSFAGALAPVAASAATVTTKVIVKHPHPHCRTVRTTAWHNHHKVVTVRKICR
jgi:hypothetical protein